MHESMTKSCRYPATFAYYTRLGFEFCTRLPRFIAAQGGTPVDFSTRRHGNRFLGKRGLHHDANAHVVHSSAIPFITRTSTTHLLSSRRAYRCAPMRCLAVKPRDAIGHVPFEP